MPRNVVYGAFGVYDAQGVSNAMSCDVMRFARLDAAQCQTNCVAVVQCGGVLAVSKDTVTVVYIYIYMYTYMGTAL